MNELRSDMIRDLYDIYTKQGEGEVGLLEALNLVHDWGYFETEGQLSLYARRILWEYEACVNNIKELGLFDDKTKDQKAESYFGILIGLTYVKTE